MKMAAFWGTPPCSNVEADQRFWGAFIALITEAVGTFETSVYFEATRRNIPQTCHIHSRCRKNLKSHNFPTLSPRNQ
jgi:hypothetical protein